jgi:predicted LPLAT superfamily acyltransferase
VPAVPANPSSPRQPWSGRSRGGAFFFHACAFALPWVGARGAWLISFLLAPLFLLLGGRDQFGMVPFWRRLRPRASYLVLVLLAWRQFASFGRILCDRMLLCLKPGNFQFDYRDGHHLTEALASRRGCILLSAHIGNWEISTFWMKHLSDLAGTVHLVMIRDDLGSVQRFVDQHLLGAHLDIIDPRDGLGAALAIRAALAAGEPVCMLGDRGFGDQPTESVDFLGRSARFPLGPFQTAALTGVPIVVCFLMKTGLNGYCLSADPPWRLPLPARRAERGAVLRRAVLRWAKRLELQVRRHPQQWHNFYDFWK